MEGKRWRIRWRGKMLMRNRLRVERTEVDCRGGIGQE